jgi:hypothetical protein
MLLLASSLGLAGTGWAQLAASAVQFAIALRLATVRPTGAGAFATLLRCLVCATLSCAPAWWLFHERWMLALPVLAMMAAPWVFVVLARRMHVLTDAERERVRAVLARRGATPALLWFVP